MKVCQVGNFGPEFSTENDVRKAFEHLDHEVVRIQENEANWAVLRYAALSSDLLLWTSTWDDAQPLDRSIETLWMCAERGIPTATLHLDTFWGVGRGGRNWRANPMFQTRHVFTADGDYQHRWDAVGVEHHWLPPAVRHNAIGRGAPRSEYLCDVALVGSNGQGYHELEWPYRKELHAQLRAMCARRGWTFRNPGGDEPKVDRDQSLNDFYASARVIIGDSLCLKREASRYWSDRVPETLGRGGFLIMPQIDALGLDFPGLPMYPWGDWDYLEEMISDALRPSYAATMDNMRDVQMGQVRHAHTYVNRAQEIIKTVGL